MRTSSAVASLGRIRESCHNRTRCATQDVVESHARLRACSRTSSSGTAPRRCRAQAATASSSHRRSSTGSRKVAPARPTSPQAHGGRTGSRIDRREGAGRAPPSREGARCLREPFLGGAALPGLNLAIPSEGSPALPRQVERNRGDRSAVLGGLIHGFRRTHVPDRGHWAIRLRKRRRSAVPGSSRPGASALRQATTPRRSWRGLPVTSSPARRRHTGQPSRKTLPPGSS